MAMDDRGDIHILRLSSSGKATDAQQICKSNWLKSALARFDGEGYM